ncbi:hypothetical protein K2173_000817 [Erythroxylum novogranatense]|uniref:UspA domain-containing protein n=1 Tax=Erythroxylum novogranatense TaxID=1862640 RepID=A0AAV8S876_9ROSI|nr:hypothetical protein K2173_000817 [Erythroxylum novogranatense]
MEGVKMKIVVAVDESEESMHALYILLVFSADVIATMERYGDALVKSVLERAEAVYKNFNNDLNVEKVVRTGEAKDVICNTVEKLKPTPWVLLGSVSDHCAK